MGHLGYRLRAEIRQAWRGAVVVAVLLALLGGVVLASVAGARRTASAYPRLLRATNAPDLLVSPFGDEGYDATGAYADVAALAEVRRTGAIAGIPLLPVAGTPTAELTRVDNSVMSPVGIAMAPLDDQAYRTVGRPAIVDGRLPEPDVLDEALITRRVATATGLRVGDRLDMALGSEETTGNGLLAIPGTGEALRITVVGIGEFPSEVIPYGDLDRSGTMLLPAAFGRRVDQSERYFEGLLVDTVRGTDNAVLADRIGALSDQHPELNGYLYVTDRSADAAQVQDGLRPLVVALAAFATVLGLATAFVVGQAIARHVRIGPEETLALVALGTTRRQRALVAMARAAVIAAGGAIGAVVVAVAVSDRFPIGPARLAEPDPGRQIDWLVLVLGAVGIVVVSVAVVLPSIVLASSVRPAVVRGSRLSAVAARLGLRPAAVQGVRAAAGPATATRGVPTRSTTVATAVAIAAVMTAATFSASLAALVDTPSRYGQAWDRLIDGSFGPAPAGMAMDRFGDDPAVAGIAVGSFHQATVNGQLVATISMATVKGDTVPVAVAGRSATAASEIALGSEVMHDLGVGIGDTVELADDSGARPVEVVGEVVFPHFVQGSFGQTGLGSGAQVHTDELSMFLPPDEAASLPPGYALNGQYYNFVALDLTGDPATIDAVDADLDRMQRELPEILIRSEQRPTTIADLGRVRTVPVTLAVLLTLSAVALVAHLLHAAVRSRRRELAVLAALGCTRRQLRSTIRWHASTVVLAATVAGLPAGVVVGRVAWSTFAAHIHASSDPLVPLAWTATALPIAVVVANVVAALPARRAGRTRPAVVLHEE